MLVKAVWGIWWFSSLKHSLIRIFFVSILHSRREGHGTIAPENIRPHLYTFWRFWNVSWEEKNQTPHLLWSLPRTLFWANIISFTHWTLSGRTQCQGHWSAVASFAWQRNKATLFLFTPNSVSVIFIWCQCTETGFQ